MYPILFLPSLPSITLLNHSDGKTMPPKCRLPSYTLSPLGEREGYVRVDTYHALKVKPSPNPH